jgi:hypothetical protein
METKLEYENAQGLLWITRESGQMYRLQQLCACKKGSGDHLKAQYKQSTGQTGKQHENRLQHVHFPVTK